MKPDVKEKWVAALRSGEYKQGKGCLKSNDDSIEHCCLGVLCELHAKENNVQWSGENEEMYISKYDTPPSAVLRWAELNSELGGTVIINHKVRELANHNDNGVSFIEIADAIEQQL